MQYALQVSTPASQVLAPVAPQELQSQKLAFLTKRANRAAGMQMIVHSPQVIYPVGSHTCSHAWQRYLPFCSSA